MRLIAPLVLVAVAVALVSAMGCSSNPAACKSDIECNGSRICKGGACVDPTTTTPMADAGSGGSKIGDVCTAATKCDCSSCPSCTLCDCVGWCRGRTCATDADCGMSQFGLPNRCLSIGECFPSCPAMGCGVYGQATCQMAPSKAGMMVQVCAN